MKELNDTEVMFAVQNGNTRALGELYERHHLSLYKYFYRCTMDKEKSEDLVQNVFLRILRYKHNFRGEGRFNYWLFSLARNVWYDSNRRKDPLKQHATEESLYDYQSQELTPEKGYRQKERKEILMHALNRLSPEKKEAIILSRFHEMKYKEIAQMANCTENAIKSRISRGLLELKELLNENEL